MRHRATRLRSGFTLIELVVVLAVLVILAAGIVAKLDVLQLRANKGVAASDMASISRLMQTYVVANNRYPNGFDSLINDNGGAPELWGDALTAVPVPPAAALDPQLVDGVGTTHQKIVMTALTTGEVNSLGRMGISTVYDLDATSDAFPSDRFTTSRTLADTGAVAMLNSTLNGATAPGDDDADAIMRHFYPQTNGAPPSSTRVLVFGLGPRCELVGRSGLMQSAPLYANSANRNLYYARDLVCFEVSSTGSRARFLGALGADADRLDEEVTEFYELQ